MYFLSILMRLMLIFCGGFWLEEFVYFLIERVCLMVIFMIVVALLNILESFIFTTRSHIFVKGCFRYRFRNHLILPWHFKLLIIVSLSLHASLALRADSRYPRSVYLSLRWYSLHLMWFLTRHIVITNTILRAFFRVLEACV